MITHLHDAANQLIRENNPYENRTWVWTYDDAGNILSKKEYVYTLVETDELGSASKTYSYGYGNADWGDLLTSYNGKTITYDEIGNPLSDGTWTYTWKQGRQLASMTDGRYIWSYAYDANGMRISRNAGSITYTYVYNGTQLIWMTDGLDQLHFTYDATGRPLTMEYHPVEHTGDSCGAYCGIYYYVTNLQGDVIAILDSSGNLEAEYTYDAWGNLIDNPDDTFGFIGHVNPLRYRGYLYDRETGLYYLQSRYYNPEIGRFINGDKQLNAKDGPIGCNMFAYCNNNPVNFFDPMGNSAIAVCIFIAACTLVGAACGAFTASCTGGDILESTIEGAITGAIAAAVTLAVPELMAVLLPATLKPAVVTAVTIGATFLTAASGGLLTDLTIQAINQENGKTPANAGVDWGRALKTAGMTGLAAVVPTFVKPFESVSNAIMAAVVGMDASVINAAAEIVITIFLK